MSRGEADYIWRCLPDWMTDVRKGHDPTFYGTLSYEGDLIVHDIVKRILKK